MNTTKTILAAVAAATLRTVHAAPVPSAAQLHTLEQEIVAIVHFGPNTFADREWGYGDTSAAVFNPGKLDARQWVEAAKAGGIKRIILVCKHHDGFCLWPSPLNTDYSVAASPWRNGKGDLVRETADAARAAGLEFAAYLSPWDRRRADYATESYTAYYHAQWKELMDGYGPLAEIWLDGANGGTGWYGGARERRIIPGGASAYYDFAGIVRLVEEKAPDAAIFGIDCDREMAWPGNERGIIPEDWPLVNANGEFKPAEADTPLRRFWFWHAKDHAKPLEELSARYLESVGRSGILNLGLAPNTDGLLDDGDVQRLREFGDWVRAFNAVDLAAVPGEKTFDAIDLKEDVSCGVRVTAWRVLADGREIAKGGRIGYRRIVRLAGSVTANDVTVETESEGEASVSLALRRLPPLDSAAGHDLPAAGAIAASFRDDGPARTFDTGKQSTIGGFFYLPDAAPAALAKGWTASVSDDGSTWRKIGEDEFGNIRANPVRQDVHFKSAVTARWLKVELAPFPDADEKPRWGDGMPLH